ncbi:MAG: peptide ABC transporter substrate-binding protein [Pyrinomonadaceae bacterium]
MKSKITAKYRARMYQLAVVLTSLSLLMTGCMSSGASRSEFFGKTEPPEGQVLRYVSGSEPESLDPHLSTGQPEGRIYMSLYEGLVEYHPKTMEPTPAIAERWDINSDLSEMVFHLRRNARWSNGEPITAHDFVYSFRRGLAPETAARAANLAYYIKYSQPYNEGAMFVRDSQTGAFLLEKDFAAESAKTDVPAKTDASSGSVKAAQTTNNDNAKATSAAPTEGPTGAVDTEFHRFIHSPARLTVAADEKDRAEQLEANSKLKAAIAGKELVPVKGEDIGVEAVDDFTVRITFTQSAPFFLGLLAHQFFKVVPKNTVEKFGVHWTQANNIVTSGPFKLKSHKPYNAVIVERNPYYWDAANVKLQEIHFYPLEENTTIMNLYKAGEIDGMLNHAVPAGWVETVRPMKDYMDAPEVAIEFYLINTKKPPMNDKRVRRAFSMAIDRNSLAKWKKTAKPLTAFSPEGIFPGYPQPKGLDFDPEQAKQLLAEAGYKDASGKFDPKRFPVGDVEITYNTTETNKATAEFVQAQWKQNLSITVPIKNMEFKTYLNHIANVEYKGFARRGWVGDYMDPFTFLNLFYTAEGDNGTGWWDPKYAALLDEANRTLDPQKRYEMLAKAEAMIIEAQPIIPIWTPATNWMKKPYVKGMYPNPGSMFAWKYVYIEPDPAKWDRGVPQMIE